MLSQDNLERASNEQLEESNNDRGVSSGNEGGGGNTSDNPPSVPTSSGSNLLSGLFPGSDVFITPRDDLLTDSDRAYSYILQSPGSIQNPDPTPTGNVTAPIPGRSTDQGQPQGQGQGRTPRPTLIDPSTHMMNPYHEAILQVILLGNPFLLCFHLPFFRHPPHDMIRLCAAVCLTEWLIQVLTRVLQCYLVAIGRVRRYHLCLGHFRRGFGNRVGCMEKKLLRLLLHHQLFPPHSPRCQFLFIDAVRPLLGTSYKSKIYSFFLFI